MKNSAKIIIALIILVLAALAAVLIITSRNATRPEPEQLALTSPVAEFAWRYQDGGNGLDGLPKTVIFLDVHYANGKVVSKQVDEVQGSCNDIDAKASDADRVTGTTKIQCYAAGFGSWYKIVKGGNAYEVHRKYFEEGNPDEPPARYEWETITTISS